MKKAIEKFNAFCAERLSLILSSMWLFWGLALVLIVLGIINPMNGVFEGFYYFSLPTLTAIVFFFTDSALLCGFMV